MRDERFWDRLRRETNEAHERASGHPFMAALLGGDLGADGYARYLAALEPVYAALETAMRATQDASTAVFDHRALDRRNRLCADLVALAGPDWAPSTAGASYAAAVAATAGSPHRLLAHHYTRYLGDLAGGQAIAALVRREYGIDATALTYLDFSALGDTHHYRKQYRVLLDLLPWSASERAEFIGTAASAYDLSADMFDALAVELALPQPTTGVAVSLV